MVSARKAQHQDIKEIETPDPYTVVFKLGQVNMSMLLHFASPFNCVYSAKKLKENPNYPETEVMGTGAFKFVEYAEGLALARGALRPVFPQGPPLPRRLQGLSSCAATRWSTACAAASTTPSSAAARRRSATSCVETMKDKVTVQEGPWVTNILLTFNTEHKPFDDIRVRQALTLAIDRWGGSNRSARSR